MKGDQDRGKPEKPEKPHETTFYVDNEEFTTTEKNLTVRQILELSGNTPAENYFLIEYRGQSDQGVRHDDLAKPVAIHEGHRFAAGYRGETPLS